MSYIKIGNFNLHRLDSISGTFYIQNQCDICDWHGEWHYQSDPKQHQNCADERAAHECQNACDHDWEHYDKDGYKICTYEYCNKKQLYNDDEKHDAKINQTYSVYE